MLDDDREIVGLMVADGHAIAWVGDAGITAIRPYREPGLMEWMTWFAVYRGDTITERVNGALVGRVQYADKGGA